MNHFFLFFFHIVVYLFLSANVTNVQGDRGTVHGIDGVVHVVVENIQLYMIPGMDGVVHVIGEHHVHMLYMVQGLHVQCTLFTVLGPWLRSTLSSSRIVSCPRRLLAR